MKKWILLLPAVLLLFAAQSAQAQKKHEVELFLGIVHANASQDSQSNAHDLYYLYTPEEHFSVEPVFTLDYNYKLLSFLKLGAQFSYTQVTHRIYYRMDSKVGVREKLNLLYLLPQVKFCIPGTAHFRPYAKVAAGIQYSANQQAQPVSFAWEVVPIGFEWGGNFVYGTADLCYGTVVKGMHIGIGFRF